MVSPRANIPRYRNNFASIKEGVDLPFLLDIQLVSYQRFLQMDIPDDQRQDIGLQGVFKSVFPIKDFYGTSSIEFVSYSLGKPRYSEQECMLKGLTYAFPIKVKIRLIIWDLDDESDNRSIRDIKEQEVYFGEIPQMTGRGTFIINGTERVIVSQLHRSPGVFFAQEGSKSTVSGMPLFSARVIPYRGSWIDFEFDSKDIIHVRIDRRRKLPATILLRALGYSTEELLNLFYDSLTIVREGNDFFRLINYDNYDLSGGYKCQFDIVHPETGEVLLKKGRKVNRTAFKRMKTAEVTRIPIPEEEVLGTFVSHDIIDQDTGEVLIECNQEMSADKLEMLRASSVNRFELLFIDNINVGSFLRDTLLMDKIVLAAEEREQAAKEGKSEKEMEVEKAMLEIYRRLRPGEPPTIETAASLFHNLFFNPERYDLSRVGRLKINHKLETEQPLDCKTLTKEDIIAIVRYLLALRNGKGVIDDIDHLGNRRVRTVGELVENQYRIGLVRMEKSIRERMSLQEIDTAMPHDLINSKPVAAAIKEFFGSSQLSQFMDQTNPLSEITHKRRLSALGPGGLTRERAGFEVRDVHPTHYGRVCPIETPEGPNIGLISSLSTYARINDFGFVETPYRVVKDGKVTEEIRYLYAMDEDGQTIAQANAPLSETGEFINELVSARKSGEFMMLRPEEINYMDVSPKQLVSVAASLIPFLEHDDANRALMGSNMQRQAVPLLLAEAPMVGTGMESRVARDSGIAIVAKRDGVVEYVDATKIVVRSIADDEAQDVGVDIYPLIKFWRSNQNTCFNHVPLVRNNDLVRAGEVLADGPSMDQGELALGQNVMVAFMPWGGYNYEDSILINERMIREDKFTSIHIEVFEVVSRDTKLGPEEITRDIPNVGDEALASLDEDGIIHIGAHVNPGDILVGKITPKGETQLSPEEKLLRAIFGEKAGEVRDTSLRVSPGVKGVVIDTKTFARKGFGILDDGEEDREREIAATRKAIQEESDIVRDSVNKKIRELLAGQTLLTDLLGHKGEVLLPRNTNLTAEMLVGISYSLCRNVAVKNAARIEEKINQLIDFLDERLAQLSQTLEEKIENIRRGDELPPGVNKMVKVYVAIKRKLSVGDKMSGRHGNKGVLSKIVPTEDMPYQADGTSVDIVLNPLGVPSRMNVGQILETHLGWAAKSLGSQISAYLEEHYAPDKLRQKLEAVYRFDQTVCAAIARMNDDDIRRLAAKVSKFVPMATQVFDGASEDEIKSCLREAGLPESGQVTLYDGRTGEPFDRPVTVGYMYILKLHHLVDDKMHARSIGPYSLVTQQPLGGKAQFGGQRLGEMEVWALEAYGASYSLQELLTVKSDDVAGRTRMYEAIVKGRNELESGLPESFNVLVKELQSLCLDVDLEEKEV
ncbi:MAG: DNA-directed RNA polymerase subunit beta [Deltaproteobacteria bacterium]|nr:DNA-directed RNA polymerase subunit beta [Candidatus Anaeroferrophillus wilburensis]MBN2888424.1 DNA-directed RNA polymerase subunit beta [Deltaproteobacteria bacterium]